MFKILFWITMALTLILSTMPAPPQVPASDKVQHGAAFLILACFAATAYPSRSLIVLFVLLTAFGAAIELLQMLPMLGRYADFRDLAADAIAAAAGLACVYAARRLSHHRIGQ